MGSLTPVLMLTDRAELAREIPVRKDWRVPVRAMNPRAGRVDRSIAVDIAIIAPKTDVWIAGRII